MKVERGKDRRKEGSKEDERRKMKDGSKEGR